MERKSDLWVVLALTWPCLSRRRWAGPSSPLPTHGLPFEPGGGPFRSRGHRTDLYGPTEEPIGEAASIAGPHTLRDPLVSPLFLRPPQQRGSTAVAAGNCLDTATARAGRPGPGRQTQQLPGIAARLQRTPETKQQPLRKVLHTCITQDYSYGPRCTVTHTHEREDLLQRRALFWFRDESCTYILNS